MIPTGTNPTRHVERFVETGIRRAFTTAELQALGIILREAEEAESIHPSAILAIRLLAMTGFRRAKTPRPGAEVAARRARGLRWGAVDLDEGFVHLRDSKTGPQIRTIGAAAVQLLRQAKPALSARNHCVCPGKVKTQPFAGIDKVRRTLWEVASIEGVDLHSLRHSFASIGAHLDNGRFAGHVTALFGHGYSRARSSGATSLTTPRRSGPRRTRSPPRWHGFSGLTSGRSQIKPSWPAVKQIEVARRRMYI